MSTVQLLRKYLLCQDTKKEITNHWLHCVNLQTLTEPQQLYHAKLCCATAENIADFANVQKENCRASFSM